MNNGPNHPSGGASGAGGRGRGRRGRRQNKRGPGQQHGRQRGHSKNQQLQNQRTGGGIYTAPMDHSYRANMQGGQNGQGGKLRGAGFSVLPDPEPVPANNSESAPTRIFAYIEDLFFLAKIQEISRKLNIKVEFVKTEKDILDRIEQNGDVKPALIIVDLNNVAIKPVTLISKLKARLKKQTNIIGFLSHIQGELKLKAQEAGCDMVLPRSAFSQNLPQLLRRHAVEEEEIV